MAARLQPSRDRYFERLEAAYTDLATIAGRETWLVQLVGFNDLPGLLNRYLDVMDRCGFEATDPHAAVRAVMDPAPSLRPVADPDCRRGAWQLPTASEPLTVIRAPETTR